MSLAPCPHRPPCPGCPRYGASGPPADALERLARLAGARDAELADARRGAASGFRHRARLMVRGRARSPKVGLFQAGSHRIVDVPHCVVHHPRINEVAAALKRAVRETGIAPYADRPHSGALRTVQVVVERASGSAQVTLVGNAESPSALAPLVRPLTDALGAALHSLWWNGNPARANVLLGTHWERWSGPEAVIERIGGADVCFPPGAFGQSHLDLADAVVADAQAAVPDGARVAELYAGCGAIGLGLLPRVSSLALNEVAPHGLWGLALGLARRSEAERARARVVPGPAAEATEVLTDTDCVVVDPPRRGLCDAVLDALGTGPAGRLVYVSCGLDALERDTARLCDASGWRLARLAPFDLMPYTEHVETLAIFDRG